LVFLIYPIPLLLKSSTTVLIIFNIEIKDLIKSKHGEA
jgi:hypothetical protein